MHVCRILRLDNNRLSGLPQGLLNLKYLISLSMRHNNFSELPYRFGNLRYLEKLDLGENMLKILPPTMVSKYVFEAQGETSVFRSIFDAFLVKII